MIQIGRLNHQQSLLPQIYQLSLPPQTYQPLRLLGQGLFQMLQLKRSSFMVIAMD